MPKLPYRWEECVSLVSSYMYLSVSALYVRKYFNEEAKNNVINIVSDVRKEFRQILEKVSLQQLILMLHD